MANQHTSNNTYVFIFLLFLFLLPNTWLKACNTEENPLLQEQSVCACAIIVNEKDVTDTLIFQLEVDMIVSLLRKSEYIRKMSKSNILESLDNLTPFTIEEKTFREIKENDWGIHPSAYLDSIYSVDGINGIIADCFFPVDSVMYLKNDLNKDNNPIFWTDYLWEKHPGDHCFNDKSYIVYLLQKHHIYTGYDNFINIRLLSNVNIVMDSVKYEPR